MASPARASSQPSGFLTRDGIIAGCRKKSPLIDPPIDEETEGLGGWSYDMRLGHEVFLSSETKVWNLADNQAFFIQPGDFALLTTQEKLALPSDLVAFITLRLGIALKGLINVSGFHVDPGYAGRLVFSVYNAGPNPVVVRQGDRIFMIVFAHLDGEVNEKFRANAAFNGIERLKAEWIAAAKGPSVNLVKLNRRVERLQSLVDLLIGVLVATAATIVAALALGVKL